MTQKNLKLAKIILENIRGFEEYEFDLTSSTGIRNWAVLLGDNGVGKSTFLRAVGLALGDRSHSEALLQDISGDFIRRNARRGRIRLEFTKTSRQKKPPSIDVSFDSNGSITKHTTAPKDFPWERLFICGYGAGRGVSGTESYTRYRVSDAIYSLFRYDQTLQNEELILRRLVKSEEEKEALLAIIDKILMLPEGSTKLTTTGIKIEDFTFSSLGDGYQGTLSWLTDLLGWAMYHYDSAPTPGTIEGVILIDEIDQHLHPRWQRRILGLLHDHFPYLQIITTTHSPVVALGATDLNDEDCKIFSLRFDEQKRATAIETGPPHGKRVDQILTSELFGLLSASDDETEQLIQRYARISAETDDDGLLSQEKARLKALLDARLASPSTEIEEVASKAIDYALNHVLEESIKGLESIQDASGAVKYEILKQIAGIREGRGHEED